MIKNLALLFIPYLLVQSLFASLPDSYDLRNFGWVPEIQDQGSINDCWAFSTATAIESNLLKKGY